MSTQQLLNAIIRQDDYPLLNSALLDKGSTKTVKAGQFLFRQGDHPGQLSVVLTGWVEFSYIDLEGNYVIVERTTAGQWYGDGNFVDGQAVPYSALVLNDVTVLSLPHPLIRADKKLEAEVYRLIANNAVARLRIMYRKFDSIATLPIEQRILERLEQLRGASNVIEITHDELASYIGTSRHKVSRAMKRLDNDNKIKQLYKKVEII
ncbi:Crp/Fnr family transcriptional regulator [Vibrio agarivorans]|uniref:Crp/Fnr family transcriptional regulator n=1 Tax=Vibrio agarivorans TaxID=153622 RepID=A0ABT7Y525_9VIBR|nr:Crp/Fnr family transcriptional regulator [Vibrio agarivorans]MDN2483076.1 Crp/Fnr family transcriptional regulator [Vibrio agarivorans]